MSRTVLVTGGAGFIGSHVCEALLARGDEVVCLDSLDDYYDPEIKRQNIAPLRNQPTFTFYRGDIRDASMLGEIAERHSIDAVIHLAARAGVRPSIQLPALYADVNIAGTSNVLEFARKAGIRTFVFASSSSVYGERTETPFRVTDPVDRPVSPYAATKRAGELIAHTYHHLYGMDIACLRFFTVYGPRQRPEMAIHKFTRLLASGQPIPMFGDGSSQRDYTYIDDIVDGVLSALDHHRGYEIYNLGNCRMVSLKELVETLAQLLDVEPRIDARPDQPGDVSRTCADIASTREQLGYEPTTSIEEGLRAFVEWCGAAKVACA
ncbi:MAG: GDP-mannose 4,6-dehydratase [Planctomycetes bacterium]|nr:GDP-mannose 4,6-dehydratase [Planctomycetota bacterium]